MTSAPHTRHDHMTSALHTQHDHMTSALHTQHAHMTSALHTQHAHMTSAPHTRHDHVHDNDILFSDNFYFHLIERRCTVSLVCVYNVIVTHYNKGCIISQPTATCIAGS